MDRVPDPRFALEQVSATDWAIVDLQYPDVDHRRVVCRVYEDAPTEVEVLWLRDLPLALRYSSVDDVLTAVQRFHDTSRATRPIPIPRLPPPTGRAGRGTRPR
ncbi:hypothetical protein F6W69_15885 [Microbacterium oxydans]|uniref:hypothetical protein n=1 Tax=Microbacterium TaxID=33882 RepID=UPI000734BF26|nr:MULTISPECIES: hypothetical protein [Microbacterium]KAB1889532.1 hypothetical protein F6W69_15885 [Microbacterium oxydans]KTR73919.1 hypothetical protein NS234_19595 [Microbacterium oxydans]MCB8043525.1 hypothetical protein [Microbacterium oxydans]GED39898.1 hypothetical protein MOX01_30400 [Microbacterium oxydans]